MRDIHAREPLCCETEPIIVYDVLMLVDDPQSEAQKLARAIASCQAGSMYGQYALGELMLKAEANDDAEALALFQLAAGQNLSGGGGRGVQTLFVVNLFTSLTRARVFTRGSGSSGSGCSSSSSSGHADLMTEVIHPESSGRGAKRENQTLQ